MRFWHGPLALILLASIVANSQFAVARTPAEQGVATGATVQHLSTPSAISARGSTPSAESTQHLHFIAPVSPLRVLTGFKPPAKKWEAGHRGVDLAAAAGSDIVAAGAGIVAFAGFVVDRPVVSIDHILPSGMVLRTTYEPVQPVVSAGQPVELGQLIGTVLAGHTSCAPADCLHWGARIRGDTYVDPLALLGGYRVRLLPWQDQQPHAAACQPVAQPGHSLVDAAANNRQHLTRR